MEIIGLIIAVIAAIAAIAGVHYTRKQALVPKLSKVGDDEFQESLNRNQKEFAKIVPEGSKHQIWSDGKSCFEIINGNITDASTEIVVSSDDNILSASGGVAKAILKKAGKQVASDLDALRSFRWRHGSMAVTRAGKFPSRYIAHPVIIDHRFNLYPNEHLVRDVTKRCLYFADTVDADSISIPVFGGGTGAKNLSATQSIRVISDTITSYMKNTDNELKYVALYVFNKKDIPNDLISDAH